jgi:hypothetical protein
MARPGRPPGQAWKVCYQEKRTFAPAAGKGSSWTPIRLSRALPARANLPGLIPYGVLLAGDLYLDRIGVAGVRRTA